MSTSGTNFAIKSVRIDDSLTQRAASCTLTFAAEGEFAPPPIEFSGSGDSATLTGSTLRPTGTTIEIKARHSNVPLHTIFRGILETMDNQRNSDDDVWDLHLSAMPRLMPHRTRGTKIFDSFYTDGLSATSSQTVLTSFAKQVSLTIGRNDMPNYVILDTYEIIHQNAIDVANSLLAPFNLFDYLKFYVRTDADGLQIMKVDYTAAGGGESIYEVPNVKSWERSFEMYMPDNRLGTLENILLVGGNEVQYKPEEKGPLGAGAGNTPNPIFRNPVFGNQSGMPPTRYEIAQDYTASTRDQNQQITFERWTETVTSMIIIVDVYPSEYIASFNTDVHVVTTSEDYYFWASQGYSLLPNDGAGPGTLEGVVNGLADGTYNDAKVVENYTVKSVQKEYDSINGLIQETVSNYNYDTIVTGDGTYYHHTVPQRVLLNEQTLATVFPGGMPFDKSLTKRIYTYDQITAVRTATQTLVYYNYRGILTLFDTQFDEPIPIGTTTAKLQLYAHQQKSSGHHANPQNDPVVKPTNLFGGSMQDEIINRKTIVGQYKLLNGVPVNMGDLSAFSALVGVSIMDGGFAVAETRLLDFTIPTAFHINCPGMNFDGLLLVWSLVQRERALEATNAYWEIVKAVCSIDTAPVIGASVRIAGMYGIVAEKHDALDSDSGLTTIVVKRIHG